MRFSHCKERRADSGAGTEAKRGFYMLDRDVGLTGHQPEDAADVPAAGVVRVERQGAVNQRHHGADVLAEMGQRVGGSHQEPGSSPATSRARLAKSAPFRRSAAGSLLQPSLTSREQQNAAQASAGP